MAKQKKAAKSAHFKARIVKLSKDGRTAYGVYVR